MNATRIELSNSIKQIAPRRAEAHLGRSGIGNLVTILALIATAHSSTPAKAGDFVLECSGAPYGYPCADTDFNQCTRAACNGSGNCNQNATLLLGQPCHDFDGDVCTVARCESDFSGSARCDQDHPNPDNPPCPDTDGDVCSVSQCYQGVCDQSFYVPVGQECGEPDNDVCAFHFCERDYEGNGVCASATITSCNDNNPCTFDHGCHPVLGCQHTTILCFETDGNECTVSQCDPSTGHCDDNAIRRIGEPCQDTDGSPCTVALCADPCTGGDCGAYVACDQLADCTDETPPEATCPPRAVDVFCRDSTDIGDAEFKDDCDLDLDLSYVFNEIPTTGPAVLEVFEQAWVATNDCQLSSECAQTVTVFRPKFYLDIQPGSCPNLMDFRSRGTLRMSLVGTAEFDVNKVDISSVRLTREGYNGAAIEPMSAVLQDTATPFDGGLRSRCGCHRLTGDGIMDLTLKFSNMGVNSALQLNTVPPGANIRLVVVGKLSDGCEFSAADCMVRPPR